MYIFEGLTSTKGRLKTSGLNLLNNAVNVLRNVASANVMMADEGMERMRTEGFVSRFIMKFGTFICLCVGGRGVCLYI
jgi:hypothetical protein